MQPVGSEAYSVENNNAVLSRTELLPLTAVSSLRQGLGYQSSWLRILIFD